MTHTILFSQEI